VPEPEFPEDFMTDDAIGVVIKDPLSNNFAPAVIVGHPSPGDHASLILVSEEISTDPLRALYAARRHALMIDEP